MWKACHPVTLSTTKYSYTISFSLATYIYIQHEPSIQLGINLEFLTSINVPRSTY